jgi:hypothetical protein
MKAERFLISGVSLLFLLLVAAVALPALAQTGTFDLASFTPPAGWEVSQNQTAITYTAIDQATRTYCSLVFMPARPVPETRYVTSQANGSRSSGMASSPVRHLRPPPGESHPG